ncbi:MAG: class I SAM-dependent methyltransferase [Holosporales bacterium]|jgi:SAM-dependent methyltransferase|nr:class I SAM-dependent methyltransferase [Holosporales bacterium]
MLEKPSLYQKSEQEFWTDPHIAQEMLKQHLDPRTDLASRRPALIEKAIDFIASLVPNGSTILDMGCGPGLYAKRLSEKGFDVTGVDFSENSIEYAKAHDNRSKYRIQNYLAMDFCEAFDIIICIWCDYGALVPDERKILLKKVYNALKPGGLFLCDVFTLSHFHQQVESCVFEVCENGGFWSPNAYLSFHGKYKYDGNVLGERYTVVEKEKIRIFNLWNSCFSEQTLSAELKEGKLSIQDYYSGVTNKCYKGDSECMGIVAQK